MQRTNGQPQAGPIYGISYGVSYGGSTLNSKHTPDVKWPVIANLLRDQSSNSPGSIKTTGAAYVTATDTLGDIKGKLAKNLGLHINSTEIEFQDDRLKGHADSETVKALKLEASNFKEINFLIQKKS